MGTKDEKITLRLSKFEKIMLKKKADKLGLNLTNFVLYSCILEKEEFDDIVEELKKERAKYPETEEVIYND